MTKTIGQRLNQNLQDKKVAQTLLVMDEILQEAQIVADSGRNDVFYTPSSQAHPGLMNLLYAYKDLRQDSRQTPEPKAEWLEIFDDFLSVNELGIEFDDSTTVRLFYRASK